MPVDLYMKERIGIERKKKLLMRREKKMEKKINNSRVLQLIAQIGKILSKVAFVFSIIGICGCFVGLLSNVFGSGKVFKIGGVTIYGLLAEFDAYNVKSISATLVAWLIVCIGQAVLAKFAELYFHNALMAGTPFTQVGARELRRLGILTMVIPTGCAVVAEVVQGILTGFMNVSADGWMEFNFDNEASVVVGVMFIVGSFLCGYGAELLNSKKMSQE